MKAKLFLITVLSIVIVTNTIAQNVDFLKKLDSIQDLDTAKVLLLHELEENPQNSSAMLYLGKIHVQEKSYDQAIEWLNKARKITSDKSEVYQWLGVAYLYKLQEVSTLEKGIMSGKCLENLRKSIELNPANIESRIYLANYYINAPPIAGGSIKKARLQLLELQKYDAESGKKIMARIFLKENKLDSALLVYNGLISADPNNTELCLELAFLYQQLEMYDKAFIWFEKTLKIDRNSLVSLYQIGKTAVLSNKNLKRGEKCLSIYLTKEIPRGLPGHDAAHWRLGMIFELHGQNKKAILEYEKAVKMNPNNPKYKKSLQSLKKE